MKDNECCLIYSILKFKAPEVARQVIKGETQKTSPIECMYESIESLKDVGFNWKEIAEYFNYKSNKTIMSAYCHERSKRKERRMV